MREGKQIRAGERVRFDPIHKLNTKQVFQRYPEDTDLVVRAVDTGNRLLKFYGASGWFHMERFVVTGSLRVPRCPETEGGYNEIFASSLVRYFGEDACYIGFNTCWKDFPRLYPELMKPAEEYFANAKTGHPCYGAYMMYRYMGSPLEWLKSVVENAVSGFPEDIARRLYNKDLVDVAWVQKIIEKGVSGNRGMYAHMLYKINKELYLWAKEMVEKNGGIDRAYAAYLMCNGRDEDRGWAENVIEDSIRDSKFPSVSKIAYLMHQDRGSSREWLVDIEEKEIEYKKQREAK